MSRPLIEVNDLHLSFGGEPVLRGVSLQIARGELLGLVGESGSGKTLTALSMIQLQPETAKLSGSIQWSSTEPSVELLGLPEKRMRTLRGCGIGMVFQDALTALNPVRSIGSQLIEVLYVHKRLRGAAARSAACSWLERVGLSAPLQMLARYPHQLSGGQRQRALIAIALACEPQLLICDEPTSALDVTVQKQIVGLLKDLQREQKLTLLFISHDLALTAELCDRIVVMRDGGIVESGSAARIWSQPQHPYTRGLLACRPQLFGNVQRLATVADFATNAPSTPLVEPVAAPSTNDALPLLQVDLLCAHYQAPGWTRFWQAPNPVVQDVSFTVARGASLGIVGESGSGKTTLARCLVRLHQPSSGTLQLDGADLLRPRGAELRRLRRRFQMVFQDPYSSLNPALSVEQALTEPLLVHGIGRDAAERRARVLELLDAVALPASALRRTPQQFSGGQRQRIAIARALSVEPELLICDEAVSALDVSVQAQILNLLKDLRARFGLTLIFISHDLSVIRFIADHVAVMAQGRIVEYGEVDAVYRAPQHQVTRMLIDAVPRGPLPTVVPALATSAKG